MRFLSEERLLEKLLICYAWEQNTVLCETKTWWKVSGHVSITLNGCRCSAGPFRECLVQLHTLIAKVKCRVLPLPGSRASSYSVKACVRDKKGTRTWVEVGVEVNGCLLFYVALLQNSDTSKVFTPHSPTQRQLRWFPGEATIESE